MEDVPTTYRRLTDIPRDERSGVVFCTPLRYIEAVALRPALCDSDELAEIIIDGELADLKLLILARRARHKAEEKARDEREQREE